MSGIKALIPDFFDTIIFLLSFVGVFLLNLNFINVVSVKGMT